MHYLPPVHQILLAALVVAAGIYDIRERRVPNWLTLCGALMGLALNTFLYESAGLFLSLKGLGLALLIYFPLFAIRAMGAGDAKLMAAIGALAGPANWFGIFVLTALLGGAFGIGLMLTSGRVQRTLANMGFLIKQLAYFRAPYLINEELDVSNPKSVGLPHAAMIALGLFGFLAAAAIWAPRV
jgi:prepilin peptidase CpaA